jgi:DNA-binding response OmpR family regulator
MGLQSDPTRGNLPLNPPQKPVEAERHEACSTNGEPAMTRILVVDDEANHVRVLSIGLRLDGFDVLAAEDAVSALSVLRDTPVDLAIIDLMMPGTNGIQLARHLRDRHPDVRVVLTSAYHLSEHQLVRADCGAIGFVPKPYKLTDLTAFLRSKVQDSSGVTHAAAFPRTAAS